MRINIFEGSRRIVKLIMLVGIIWYIGYAFMNSPNVMVSYLIKKPGAMPIRLETGCSSDYYSEYRSDVPLKKGSTVSLSLCFETFQMSDGKRVILYQYDGKTDTGMGDEIYSSDVTKYTKYAISNFVIPPTDEKWIESARWSARWKDIREATYVLLAGLGTLWVLTWAVGWITRGFMSIPKGKDRRPPDA